MKQNKPKTHLQKARDAIAAMDDRSWASGPWKINRFVGDSGDIYWWIESETDLIAEVISPNNTQRENANLIASSPQLYDALTELVRCVRGGDDTSGFSMDDALRDADEVLAKARGEL